MACLSSYRVGGARASFQLTDWALEPTFTKSSRERGANSILPFDVESLRCPWWNTRSATHKHGTKGGCNLPRVNMRCGGPGGNKIKGIGNIDYAGCSALRKDAHLIATLRYRRCAGQAKRLKTSCRLVTVVIKSFECGLIARFRRSGRCVWGCPTITVFLACSGCCKQGAPCGRSLLPLQCMRRSPEWLASRHRSIRSPKSSARR